MIDKKSENIYNNRSLEIPNIITSEIRLKIILLAIRHEQQLKMQIRGYNHNDYIRSKL